MSNHSRARRPVPQQIRTQRLRLRGWHEGDFAPFAELNADPAVMEFFPGLLTRSESDEFLLRRVIPHLDDHGYGLWAVDRLETGQFIGFVGLMWQTFDAPFTPALEVGWRLGSDHWGNGFATEAAAESLRIAFDVLGEPEVVSMTVPPNRRSRAVMERIGMTRDPADDFDHSKLPPGHRLRRHVLYRMRADAWRLQCDD